jgi:hypothetical protein
MRDCITNSTSAAYQDAPRHHLPQLRSFSGDAAVLAGVGRSYEEIGAGREAAAA